jgi:hypothetical protein
MASASCRRLRPVIISMCVIRRRRGRVWHTCVQMSQASRPFFFVWTLLVSHSRCALRFVPPYRFSPPFFPPRLSLCNAWVHRLSCVFLLLAKISRRLFFLVWFLFSSVLFLSKKKKMNKTNSTEIDQQRENEWRGAGTSFSDVIIILFPHVTLKHERIIYLSLRPILGFFFLSFFYFFCVYVVVPFCCCCCVIPGLYRSRTWNIETSELTRYARTWSAASHCCLSRTG